MVFQCDAVLGKAERIAVITDGAPAFPALGGQFLAAKIPLHLFLGKLRFACKRIPVGAQRQRVRRLEPAPCVLAQQKTGPPVGPPPGGGKVHLEGEVPPPGARPISFSREKKKRSLTPKKKSTSYYGAV